MKLSGVIHSCSIPLPEFVSGIVKVEMRIPNCSAGQRGSTQVNVWRSFYVSCCDVYHDRDSQFPSQKKKGVFYAPEVLRMKHVITNSPSLFILSWSNPFLKEHKALQWNKNKVAFLYALILPVRKSKGMNHLDHFLLEGITKNALFGLRNLILTSKMEKNSSGRCWAPWETFRQL